MNRVFIFVFFILSAVMLVCGLLIRYRNAYFLIAGYNTMTEAEKETVDTEKMGRTVAVMLYLLAGLAAAAGVFFFLGQDTAGLTAMLAFLPVTLLFVIRAQKSVRPNAADWKKTSRMINGLAVFFVLIALAVAGMIYSNGKPNTFSVENGALVIGGAYGQTVPLSTVSEISVEKSLPSGLKKQNGFDWESILKGRFRSDSGDVTLYADTESDSFLRLKTADGQIYISTPSDAQTRALYRRIQAALPANPGG